MAPLPARLRMVHPPLLSQKKEPVHVNLSVGAPVPFVSGYFLGIEGMLGVEWINRLEFRFKVRRENLDPFLGGTDQHVLQPQLVYYGIRRDFRTNDKGWTKNMVCCSAMHCGSVIEKPEQKGKNRDIPGFTIWLPAPSSKPPTGGKNISVY